MAVTFCCLAMQIDVFDVVSKEKIGHPQKFLKIKILVVPAKRQKCAESF